MTSKTKAWFQAARLRTLPLSTSGIIVGSGIAASKGFFIWEILVLALLTTLGFQVLSNFANDYGDGVKGTDNEHRIGPMRAVQSGIISAKEMKKAMLWTIVLTLIAAILLIYVSFGSENFGYSILFFFLGLASIVAAIKYTVGNSAYGYQGLGDIFVFLFFGFLSVLGTYFLFTKELSWSLVLLAATIGALSTAVLNLNNMRDQESDAMAEKNTLVVKIGPKAAKRYHYFLIAFSFVSVACFTLLELKSPYHFIPFLAFIPLSMHLKRVVNNLNFKDLDKELKVVALSTFTLSVLIAVVYNIFS